MSTIGQRAPLPPRDGYRMWAPRYHVETAVSALEHTAVDAVTPPLSGRALLDAGCGTGRRLAAANGARLAVGVDLVVEMIRAGGPHAGREIAHAAADVRALPLCARAFDVVWCRLVLGHLTDVEPAYAELGRVAAAGALLVMTDFHPAAAAAGHTRSFHDADGQVHTIQHHVHEAERHIECARRAGLRLVAHENLRVGPAIRRFYEDAGALDRYDEQIGMPLVLMLVFDR